MIDSALSSASSTSTVVGSKPTSPSTTSSTSSVYRDALAFEPKEFASDGPTFECPVDGDSDRDPPAWNFAAEKVPCVDNDDVVDKDDFDEPFATSAAEADKQFAASLPLSAILTESGSTFPLSTSPFDDEDEDDARWNAQVMMTETNSNFVFGVRFCMYI